MSSSKKTTSKQLTLITSQPPPKPSVDLLNRYQILGIISKPSYQSVLASDPFSTVQSSQTTQTKYQYQSPSSRTNYVLKNTINIFSKE